jgi:hypothetical protein
MEARGIQNNFLCRNINEFVHGLLTQRAREHYGGGQPDSDRYWSYSELESQDLSEIKLTLLQPSSVLQQVEAQTVHDLHSSPFQLYQ